MTSKFIPGATPNFTLVRDYVKYCQPNEFFTFFDLQNMWQPTNEVNNRYDVAIVRRIHLLVDIGVFKDEGDDNYVFVKAPEFERYNAWKREACKPTHWWSKPREKSWAR